MTILQQPDSLSLSGNIKEFRIGTTDIVSFVLLQGGEEIVSRSYEPGADGIVIIDIRDIIHSRLSFQFKNVSLVYEQTALVSTFRVLISGTEVIFSAIRCGIDAFADTATNFLTQNFLTWQPNLKPVTYYSPEFLTYYATVTCVARLRAYFTDNSGTVISQMDIELSEFVSGKAYTIPLQYASVAEKLGNEMPAYYDVWIENNQGDRLTYIQRYYASEAKSETEQWILFENSLGGIDTFRAYGSTAFTGEHTHNIAEIDDVSLEYRVDTSRKFQKNTGYLDRKERAWLLDFFPSLKKYLHTGSYLRSIIVVESNVTYTDKELPSNYTFTYKYADAKSLLNLPRTDVPSGALDIIVPEVGSFTVPPRLVEFPRLPLSEGALFPIQEPYSEEWNTTTTGSLSDFIAERIAKNYGGGGGVGHQHDNIDLLQLFSYASEYLLIAGKKLKAGYADKAKMAEELTVDSVVNERFISKIHPDKVAEIITFIRGLISEGLLEANGGLIVRSSALKNEFSKDLSEIGDSDSEAISSLLSELGDDSPESMSTPLMEVPRGGGFASGSLGEMDNTDESFDIVPDGNYMMQKRAGVFYPVKASAGGGGTKLSLSFVTPSNITVVHGKDTFLTYLFSSTLNGEETGEGLASYTLNGRQLTSDSIAQGEVSFNIGKHLFPGDNTLIIQVTDSYGASRKLTYAINSVSISITSTFDDTKAYTGAISFAYTPVGAIQKTVHFEVDGTPIGMITTSISNRQQTYNIPAQAHGAHTLEVRITATIDEIVIESEHLYYSFISVVPGNNTPIIASSFRVTEIEQFGTLIIPYIVYDPASSTSTITLSANGATINQQTVDRTLQSWSYRADTAGDLSLTITCGSVSASFDVTVSESAIDIHPEIADLALFLTSVNRSNNEEGKHVWSYGEIFALLTAFNWSTNGWVKTIEGFTALRTSGDARITIPYYAFANDFRATGKTIEFEFETRDVTDYNAIVIDCTHNNIGLQVTAQKAVFKSEQSTIETQFKENERVRVSFVVEKRVENRLIYVYVNGEMCGVIQYPDQDNFMQSIPAGIRVGSGDCTVDTFNIRVYDNNLNRYQLLDNYIADMDNLELKRSLYARNQIYDDYGDVSYDKLLDYVPALTIVGALPAFKGDKITCVMTYEDRQNPSRNWTCSKIQNDVQGTSSQYYPRKNYKFKFKANILLAGILTSKFPIRDSDIPVDCFCLKADFAESSGTHNTGLARMVDFVLRGLGQLTPPQKVDSRVRTTIDGYPIVVFYKETEDSPATFLGKYNFNNDKSTQETFGFTPGCECWELKNNTSDRVKFLSSDYASLDADGNPDWLNDFEARYPDEDDLNAEYEAGKIPVNLKRLTDWLASVKSNPTKFKAEASEYLDLPFILSYYTMTEFFGMVDQRAKNMFLTTYDGVHWIPIFYDNDTCLGINNEGVNAFDYTIEYHDKIGTQDIWNGEASSLWNNVEVAFKNEISAMYADMRKNNLLTYEVCNRFLNTEQGDRWSESVYNEDSYYKYIRPLLDNGNGSYLYAGQGSRKTHRVWWLYNRFKYMDSKYIAGDFKNDFATMRLYTPTQWTGIRPNADITITSYSGQYVNVKYGSYIVGGRTKKDVPYKITAPAIQFNDTETIIYGASQISSLGDLSALYAGTVDVTKMAKLSELIIGSGVEGYQNTNLEVLSVGSNDLMRKLDVRGCLNLRQAIDVSKCANIREVWAEGTGTTTVVLPQGGSLSLLHLPETITNLTVRNQPNLTDAGLTITGVRNLTTIRWENNLNADVFAIINRCLDLTELKLTTVRLIGIDASLENLDLLSKLTSLRGIDSNGNVTQNAVVTGKCHVVNAAEEQLAAVCAAFPELTVTYDQLIKTPIRTVIVYIYDTTTPIAGAKVILNGIEYTTDDQGKAKHIGREAVTSVVSKEGYKDNETSFKEISRDMNNYVFLYPMVSVTFSVKTTDGAALGGADVELDNEIKKTGIDGKVIFRKSFGDYAYSVSYKESVVNGTLNVVTSDVVKDISLEIPISSFQPEWNGNIQLMLNGTSVILPITSTTSDYVIDWGDGTTSNATGTGAVGYNHTYEVAANYNVEVSGCDNITNCIPSGQYLVAYWSIGNSKVSGLSFRSFSKLLYVGLVFKNDSNRKYLNSCFYRCRSLTAISVGLFDNCPAVTNFDQCFSECGSLTAIPVGLFDNCPAVTSFYYCSIIAPA